MMTPTLLEPEYKKAQGTDDFGTHASFIKNLLSANDPQAIAYHYALLKNRANKDLYLRLRAAFIKRGQDAARYLVERVTDETDPAMRADVLHLLGRLRDPAGLLLARQSMSDPDSDLRNRACYVLGWLGDRDDVTLLVRALKQDADPHVRATSSMACSQLYDRLPETKECLIANLKEALENEADASVSGWIIIALQSLLNKRFGLKEDSEEAVLVGDLQSAKNKCLQALDRMNKK